MTDTTPTTTRTQTVAEAKAAAVAEHRAACAVTPAQKFDALASMLKLRSDALTKLTGNKQRTDQLVSLLLGRVSRQPALLQCDPLSLYLCLQRIASLGLSPLEDRRHWYLVPYRNKNLGGKEEATLQVSYHGMVYLARQHKDVADVWAQVVYRGEDFEWDQWSGTIKHKVPIREEVKEADLVAAYAVVRLATGHSIVEVLNRAQILKRKAKARDASFWTAWPEEMWKKTAIRALLGSERVPKSDALEDALTRGEDMEFADFAVADAEPAKLAAPEPEPDYSTIPEIQAVTEQVNAESAGPTKVGLIAECDRLAGLAQIDWPEIAAMIVKKCGGKAPESWDDCTKLQLTRACEWLTLQVESMRQADAEGR